MARLKRKCENLRSDQRSGIENLKAILNFERGPHSNLTTFLGISKFRRVRFLIVSTDNQTLFYRFVRENNGAGEVTVGVSTVARGESGTQTLNRRRKPHMRHMFPQQCALLVSNRLMTLVVMHES
jgi:hypothetical protein